MQKFLHFARTESRRLQKIHDANCEHFSRTAIDHQDYLRREAESAINHLELAEELATAARIVRQQLRTARKLQREGCL